MFQLTRKEFEILRCQFGTSSWGGHRYLPYAFTEHGVAMLSSVLNSSKAIQINIMIIKAFIKIREILSTHKKLAIKIAQLETKYDEQFVMVFNALKHLMKEPEKKKIGQIGFKV
jgi:phage regulator Rha-like protein